MRGGQNACADLQERRLTSIVAQERSRDTETQPQTAEGDQRWPEDVERGRRESVERAGSKRARDRSDGATLTLPRAPAAATRPTTTWVVALAGVRGRCRASALSMAEEPCFPIELGAVTERQGTLHVEGGG